MGSTRSARESVFELRQSDNNRKAKFYRLTKAGRKQLEVEKQTWDRLTVAIAEIMKSA